MGVKMTEKQVAIEKAMRVILEGDPSDEEVVKALSDLYDAGKRD